MISVIVPVYNAEKFLPICLDCILAQTYTDFELLIVDDGSADSSGQICDDYAQKDKRVRVTHQANRGQSAARNVALSQAMGDWIAFVDADDIVPPNYLSYLLHIAKQAGADVACANLIENVDDAYNFAQASRDSEIKCVDPKKAIELTMYQTTFNSSPCSKLFKSKLFDDEKFLEGSIYEDLDIMSRIYERASKVAYADVGLYYYRNNPQSTLHKFSRARLDVLDVTSRLVERYRDDSLLAKATRDRRFAANFNMFLMMAQTSGNWSREMHDCWRIIKNYRYEVLLNPKSRLKNKIGAMLTFFGKRATIMINSLMS